VNPFALAGSFLRGMGGSDETKRNEVTKQIEYVEAIFGGDEIDQATALDEKPTN
jgi:hypothetical protein